MHSCQGQISGFSRKQIPTVTPNKSVPAVSSSPPLYNYPPHHHQQGHRSRKTIIREERLSVDNYLGRKIIGRQLSQQWIIAQDTSARDSSTSISEHSKTSRDQNPIYLDFWSDISFVAKLVRIANMIKHLYCQISKWSSIVYDHHDYVQ